MSSSIPFQNPNISKESQINSGDQNKEEQNIQNTNESNIPKNTEINFMENLDIQKIKELNSKCVEFIFEEKADISLEILKKLELFLESNLIESKFNFNKKLIIIILHNLACCYQKLKDYDNCITYLDGVIYHFDKELEKKHQIKISEEYFYENLNKDQSNYSLLGDLILELRFSAKYHLQMCAVLSQANRHVEALKHAKLAGLICEDNLIKTYYLFIQMKLKDIFSFENKANNNNNNNNIVNDQKEKDDEENELKNIEKMKLTQKIVNDLFNKITNLRKNFHHQNERNINNKEINNNFFDSYLKYRKDEIHKYQKSIILLNNIRNAFGAEIKKDDWIQLINIGNIMYLSPLNDEDLDLESDPKYELLRDAILEKVVMFTVSYFCIAMEMKQLSQAQDNKRINGEFFHYQAVYFSDLYLPVSCPIVKHYINSYYKYYNKDLDVVPEGKIIDYKIDLIRNEIEFNKDIQSFVRMKKINYTNNNLGTLNSINLGNINKKMNIKELNIGNFNLENSNNNTIACKKTKIPSGLKLNLNLDNILNKNNNNEINNNSNSKRKKISPSNDNKPRNNSNNKNNNNLENMNNKHNLEIYLNKNNLNIAEKSKIKEMPKFKLNFNNLNNSNEEGIPKEKEKNIKNKIKKIQNKISTHTKTNRHSASINQLKKKNLYKGKGYKTEWSNSNKRSNNINSETLIISKREKINGIDIKRSSFIKSSYNKHLSKTSRYHNKKSPGSINKEKLKGHLTDKVVMNKNKSLKRSIEKKININNYKYYAGYLTQRKLTHFKLKEKINLNVILKNNEKGNNSNNENKKIKANKGINNNSKCINKLNNKIKNNNVSNVIKSIKVENNKEKLKQNTNVNKNKHLGKSKKISLIDKLYKNLFMIELKDSTNNIYKNYGNTMEYNKYGGNLEQIHNINSLIKVKNPFKS